MDATRIKHLEMIQAVIARLAGHSFAIKGVAITVVSAILSFGAAQHHPGILYVALIPATTAWGLDGYYLRRERMFRALYETERRVSGEGTFVMDPNPYAASVPGWSRTMSSPTLLWLYFPLVVVILLARRLA